MIILNFERRRTWKNVKYTYDRIYLWGYIWTPLCDKRRAYRYKYVSHTSDEFTLEQINDD